MNILIEHICYTTRMIDAFLEQYTLGTLIVENGQAFLELGIGELIALNDSFEIQVFNGEKYHNITYQEAINTFCSDDLETPLFAGLECRVKINKQ
jgi:hypothetical protein